MYGCYYTIENDWWVYHNGILTFEYDELGLIYDSGGECDTLMTHGRYDKIAKLFLSDEYSRLAKCGCVLRENMMTTKNILVN